MEDEVPPVNGRRLVPWLYRDENNDPLFSSNDKPSLGFFVPGAERMRGATYFTWYYVPPNRPVIPVQWGTGETPPPLPKPNPDKTRDRCSACGGMNWIEIHGMADGYCTRCYYRG